MRRSGFTLAELLISAAIFSSVLLMAFSAVAAINRLQRQTRVQRLYYGSSQAAWQTVTQLARYAQAPDAAIACGYAAEAAAWPSVSLNEAVTVQNNGRRVYLVTPDMSVAGGYRVFGFAAVNPDSEQRFVLQSIRFSVTNASCVADAAPSDLLGGSGIRLRLLSSDSAPFARVTDGAGAGGNVPDANALLSTEAFGRPWRLQINWVLTATDGSGAVLPIAGQVVSRTPDQVVAAP